MGVANFSRSNLRCLLDVQAEMSSRHRYLILEFVRDVWVAGIDSGVTESQGAGLDQIRTKINRKERNSDKKGSGGQNDGVIGHVFGKKGGVDQVRLSIIVLFLGRIVRWKWARHGKRT